MKKTHSLRIVEDSHCTSQDRPTSKMGKHKTELKRVVDSSELSDVTEVMICQDIQHTDNVWLNCQITVLSVNEICKQETRDGSGLNGIE